MSNYKRRTDRYLNYVLLRIAGHPINRVEELIPWRTNAEPLQEFIDSGGNVTIDQIYPNPCAVVAGGHKCRTLSP